MDMHKGKKDGEVKIFRNGINPEAYAWKELSQKWEKLGDVVSQPPKKYYEGDKFFPKGEYDYIFNVEDDYGQNKLLPFNEGDNPMEVADKYCAREGISKRHSEPIRVFLKKNTKYELMSRMQKKQQQIKESQLYDQMQGIQQPQSKPEQMQQ